MCTNITHNTRSQKISNEESNIETVICARYLRKDKIKKEKVLIKSKMRARHQQRQIHLSQNGNPH